ncbi:MAG: glycosyltransferase [Granulosicoccus sp.]|nr:glycosyltransferase [Granulosicoccus sp.]
MHPKDVQIARISKNLHSLAEVASRVSQRRVESAPEEKNSVAPAPAGRKKGRAAVVAWDLSHNPVGRAFVLYKLLEADYHVDLVGPIWSRYGDDIWSPLKNAKLNVRAFHCSTLDEFVPKANLMAATVDYDVVYICKPRLPSIYLGSLIKKNSQCPMVLDVDDFELSFFKDETSASLDEITAQADAALLEPFEELGTRYSQSLIQEFDAVTVSNIALRQKFGGHIVRHARDEQQFVVCDETRAEARERLGINAHEFALVFIGTPRPHKGVFEVASALHELKDDSIVFHIVGTISDARVKAQFDQYSDACIVFHDDCDFDELPKLLSAADLVPLIQNQDHAISQFQIPAKISDATALGIPVIATDTPPIRDLAIQGGVEIVEQDGLAAKIKEMKARGAAVRQHIRIFFENELGSAVNRTRLANAIRQAVDANDSQDGSLNTSLNAMCELMAATYKDRRIAKLKYAESLSVPVGEKDPREKVPDLTPDNNRVAAASEHKNNLKSSVTPLFRTVANRTIGRLSGNYASKQRGYDIAFFWKQNDSGIYGRRSDMVLRYLSRSERIGRILHIDAPMGMHDVEQNFRFPLDAPNSQSDRVLYNVYDRQIGARDTDDVRYRNFLVSKKRLKGQVAGNPIGQRDDYVPYVRKQMREAGMRPERTIAWFCPIVWDAADLVDQIGFQGVVSDLIDDQRGWNSSPEFLTRLEANYADTLRRSDLVFANCQPLADAFQHYAPPINIVPNGAERFCAMPARDVPEALAGLPGPIIGYVGNLRDRIDWMLLNEVVQAWPEASFVFAGPASEIPNARQLAEYPNVHMVGVVPYDEVLSYLQAFDVGMVPHLRNRLTERMNPLKTYNYFAAGLPIVSSDVNNIENLGGFLEVAKTGDEFVAALKRAVDRKKDIGSESWQQIMDDISWDNRVDTIVQVMGDTFKRRLRKSA